MCTDIGRQPRNIFKQEKQSGRNIYSMLPCVENIQMLAYAQTILKDKYESGKSLPLERGIESVKYRLKGDLIITVFPLASCKFIPYVDIIYPKLIKYFTFRANYKLKSSGVD